MLTNERQLMEDLTSEETSRFQGGAGDSFINYSEASEYAKYGSKMGLWYLAQGFQLALMWWK
jgi:hypothetical protein